MTRQDAKLRAARLLSGSGRIGSAVYRKSGMLRYEVGYVEGKKFVALGRGASWETAFADAVWRGRSEALP